MSAAINLKLSKSTDYRETNDRTHRDSMSRRMGAFDAIARHHGYEPDNNSKETSAHGRNFSMRTYTHPETKHELTGIFHHDNHPKYGRWSAIHSSFGEEPFFGTGVGHGGFSQMNRTLSKLHG